MSHLLLFRQLFVELKAVDVLFILQIKIFLSSKHFLKNDWFLLHNCLIINIDSSA